MKLKTLISLFVTPLVAHKYTSLQALFFCERKKTDQPPDKAPDVCNTAKKRPGRLLSDLYFSAEMSILPPFFIRECAGRWLLFAGGLLRVQQAIAPGFIVCGGKG